MLLALYFYQEQVRRESHDIAQMQASLQIDQPALSILALQDRVANWVEAAKVLGSAMFLPNLTQKVYLTFNKKGRNAYD
jgi:soluble epoxide hydrolase / lipid-phosphate phosphatase